MITSGQDETVRFWDISFNPLYVVNLREELRLPEGIELSKEYDISAQSIDVYTCGTPPPMSAPVSKENRKAEKTETRNYKKPMILLGTRNGFILEAIVDQGTVKIKKQSEKKVHVSINKTKIVAYTTSLTEVEPEDDHPSETSSSEEEDEHYSRYKQNQTRQIQNRLSLTFELRLSAHSGTPLASSRNYHQKVLYALHPNLDILFTTGEDQLLCIWDIEKNVLLRQMRLEYSPTTLKYCEAAEILAVGFSNGTVYLLDGKMSVSSNLRNQSGKKNC